MLNAILCLLRTGCRRHHLPRDRFPPRSTVYKIFRKFQRDGVSETIRSEPHMALPERTAKRPAARLRFSTANRSDRQKSEPQRQSDGFGARKQVMGRKNPRLGRQRRAADAFLTLASMQLALRRLARA